MIRRISTLLLLLALTGSVTGPAVAADELAVSRDGRTWSDRLPGSLFDSTVRWVPGDTRTETFRVRNQADEPGDLRLDVSSTDPDRLLRDDEIVVRVRFDEGPWRLLDGGERSIRLEPGELGAGDEARVSVRATFDPGSGNRTQQDALSLAFLVTLSDARAGVSPDGERDDDGGLLPDTGTEVARWTVVLAGVALGTGWALMRRGTRDEGEEHHAAAL